MTQPSGAATASVPAVPPAILAVQTPTTSSRSSVAVERRASAPSARTQQDVVACRGSSGDEGVGEVGGGIHLALKEAGG